MADINEVLDRHWQELKKLHPGVLNIAIAEKWKDGVNTHTPSITVYVTKKIGASELAPNELAPKDLEGIPVDVIELAPTGWRAGKTSVSEKHPREQRNLLGVKQILVPKEQRVRVREIKAGTLQAEWVSYCSAIRDQGNCGSCVGEGCIGTIEAAIRIAENNPSDPISLSVADAFFCSGGTCDTGNDPATVLDFVKNTGVPREQDVPYKDQDMPCPTVLPAWVITKIKDWQTTTDLATIRQWITTGPLVVVMEVHQSFFNYTGGVYKNLGPQDPVAGWHCIVDIGGDDTIQAWHGRNSWNTGWGEKGYFHIAYGDSRFDDQGWQVTVGANPNPNPNPQPVPTPSKCKWGMAAANAMNIVFMQSLRGRQGRFMYMNPGK